MAYQLAKVRIRSKALHYAMILRNVQIGGVDLFLLTQKDEKLLPFGSSWHKSEAEAKDEAYMTMKIRESDWVAHDDMPEWAEAVNAATDAAVKNYLGAK
jgi:hypothetical protein